MSVRRIMGVETEYGVLAPADPGADSAGLSATVLAAYAAALRDLGRPEPVRWDYSGQGRGAAGPERVARLTEQERRWHRGTSLVPENGARLYVDHGHPEHCSPEVGTPQDAVRYDAAGDLMMRRAMARVTSDGGPPIVVYKNNVDGKGSAYGTHENYLVSRDVPLDLLARALVPFLVTRVVHCGAGRVGIGPASEEPGFQIWQRADYIERRVGPSTTIDRPIINTRDEPHADPTRWRRLHVIAGDATNAQPSTLLKLGTTALVLWVLERVGLPPAWAALDLADPVRACRDVSRDPGLEARVPLADGRRLTALQIQQVYLERVEAELAAAGSDPDTEQVRALWRGVLESLEADVASAADRVEWVAKHRLLVALGERASAGWDDPRLAAADLQWSDLRPEKQLAAALQARGSLASIVGPDAVAAAETEPPPATRAWLRGRAVRDLGAGAFAASWDSLVLDTGEDSLVRLAMDDPRRHTADDVAARPGAREALAAGDAAALLAALGDPPVTPAPR